MPNLPDDKRHLNWQACYNARDLGGLPGPAGQSTRFGAVVRSDLLARLTPVGRRSLWDYGVRTVIDLRRPEEVIREPDRSVGDGDALQGIHYLNIPLEGNDPQASRQVEQAIDQAEVYCLILDHYAHRVASALRAIAEAPAGAVLIHCHAGKDRTGIVAALLLRLVGVPADAVCADYALSQPRLWPLYAQWVAEAGAEEKVGAWLKPLTPPQNMERMLAHLDNTYGGPLPYVRRSGLTLQDVAGLSRRLLPDPSGNAG